MGWSRSSRTDKGVHAARNLCSAKLAIDVDQALPPGADQCTSDFVDKLNANLPPAIQVWSVARMTKSFQARSACSWREYEFLLPAEILHVDESESEEGERERVAAMSEALSLFQGTHR
mmetsp:Transcript_23714/g.63768  ORF Transcript_23714/g.63768 Transcript_23714/m.63768 type:complete len:118 (-) Transcript_23714:66-419(-)